MNWIHLSQERDQWGTLVNMVMNLSVPWEVGEIIWLAEQHFNIWRWAVFDYTATTDAAAAAATAATAAVATTTTTTVMGDFLE